MKLIDGDRLKNHLDYLIKRDKQFAKMCDGNDDYDRQRKYCFEVDVLAYELCKSVMDYYLVKDVQPVIYCKDCKYRKEHHYEVSGEPPYIKYECKFTKYSMSPNGFCSFGVRIDGNTGGKVNEN